MTATPQPNAAPRTTTAPGDEATPPRHAADPSIGELVSEATTAMSTIVRGEIQLAKLELKSSVKNLGVGAGAFIGALVLLVFSLTFGLLALAEGLVAIGIWRWASYLIVFGLLLVIVGLLVFIGIRKVKRVRAPEKTISTGKDTVAYLKANAPGRS